PSVVEEVHGDLRDPAARERDAHRLDRGEPSRRLADRAGDLAGGRHVVRRQPYVEGHEQVARADEHGARARVEARGAVIGRAVRSGETRGKPLVPAAAERPWRLTSRARGGPAVIVD